MYVWYMYGSAEIRDTDYIVEVRGQFSGVSSRHFLSQFPPFPEGSLDQTQISVVQEELYPLIPSHQCQIL